MASSSSAAGVKEPLSSRNVGSLSTYDIRQELTRRQILNDIPAAEISHRTMLHRLVRDLVEEEGRAAEAAAETRLREEGSKRDEAKALREQKKQQALERSRARQADPSYFAQKQQQPVTSLPEEEGSGPGLGAPAEQEEQEEEEEEAASDDPFRATKPRRNRVFVR